MDPNPSSKDRPPPSPYPSLWQLITSYWQSEQRFPAYLAITLVMVLTLTLVTLNVIYNYWYNYFYDALQSYDRPIAMRLLTVFFVLTLFYVTLAVYRLYVFQFFRLQIRRWLTEQCLGRWLKKSGALQQPNQRIEEEVGSLVNGSIDFSLSLMGIITAFLMFIYYLWLLSDDLQSVLPVSEYLVWIGVFYALAVTFFSMKFRRCIRVNKVNHKRYFIRMHRKLLTWSATGYSQLLMILPLVMVFPNYVEKIFMLGWLLQSLQAFNRVRGSLPFLLDSDGVSKGTQESQ